MANVANRIALAANGLSPIKAYIRKRTKLEDAANLIRRERLKAIFLTPKNKRKTVNIKKIRRTLRGELNEVLTDLATN